MSVSHSFLTVHVGQAGVQIGQALWELLCLEHNVKPDGRLTNDECEDDKAAYDSVFMTTASRHYIPRSLFIDTDSSCIDEIRMGQYRQLFNDNQLINDSHDSAGNYMVGRYAYNQKLVPESVERMRWLMEKCEGSPTFLVVHSTSGGTGSGLTVSCLDKLLEDAGKKVSVVELSVMPGGGSVMSQCEILNSVMYQRDSRDLTEVSFSVTNSALFNVCSSSLGLNSATFAHANRLVAAALSNLTATERYPGSLPCTASSICTNVLPFRYLKYPILSCCPFLPCESADKMCLTASTITNGVMDRSSQFVDLDLKSSSFMACALVYRGKIAPFQINRAVQNLKVEKRVKFVDWCPIGFKIGLVDAPPINAPFSGIANPEMSVTMVANSTAISQVFNELAQSVDTALQRSSHLYHYTKDDFSAEQELTEAKNFVSNVASLYQAEQDTVGMLISSFSQPSSSTTSVSANYPGFANRSCSADAHVTARAVSSTESFSIASSFDSMAVKLHRNAQNDQQILIDGHTGGDVDTAGTESTFELVSYKPDQPVSQDKADQPVSQDKADQPVSQDKADASTDLSWNFVSLDDADVDADAESKAAAALMQVNSANHLGHLRYHVTSSSQRCQASETSAGSDGSDESDGSADYVEAVSDTNCKFLTAASSVRSKIHQLALTTDSVPNFLRNSSCRR